MVQKICKRISWQSLDGSGLNKLLRKLRNTGRTRTTSQCAHWWQRCFCRWIYFESGRCTEESQNHMSNFTRDRNLPLFGIQYRSSESEVKMLEKASCARTHCCRLCVAPNSRTKTATSFPSIRCGLQLFFTDEPVWKLVDDILNTWSDWPFFTVLFAFISNWVTNFCVGFCCVKFMAVAVLGAFSAWVTIKYHVSI